ncbi:MAG: alpha/beta hydrolase [Sphingobacteriales bacterium]|nr:MAG: alpha/beta hydrolase [Sphingobacteriales bacterium]
MKKFTVVVFIGLILSVAVHGQSPAFSSQLNIVYGNNNGASLLMDMHQPAKPNGLGIIYIIGSAFGFVYPGSYDQPSIKDEFFTDSVYMGAWGKSLLQNGYTLFVINHRNTPAYKYNDIINDCRRAVRFVRFNAVKYKIDPAHIGAMGHSSGANLAAMLGTMDESFEGAAGKIDSISSKVQAVVTLAAPFDLSDYNKPGDDSTIDVNFAMAVMNAYVGEMPEKKDGFNILSGKFAAASPLGHVSAGDVPMLIYYSNNDPVIPARQAIAMEQALQKNKVAVKSVKRIGQEHGPVPDMKEVDEWFKKWLK